MRFTEIIAEIFQKGLRGVNDEINAAVHFDRAANDRPDDTQDPLRHVRPGFERWHPAHYDNAPGNKAGMR